MTHKPASAGSPTSDANSALWVVAIAAALIGYEALSYWAAVAGGAALWGPILTSTPLAALAGWILIRVRGVARIVLVGALAGLGAVSWLRHAVPDLTLLYPVPHLLMYGFFLWMFARTLRSGRESIITRVARLVHGSLPPDIEAYTRRVTWAWSVFFVLMAATSVLLFVFAPLPAWSLFAHVLNLPLLIAMFVGEYAYRIWRYPTFSHVSLVHTARAFRRFGRAIASDGH